MITIMFCPECRRKMKRFVAPGISDERWVCNTEGCDIFLITVKRKGEFYK